MRNKYAVDPDDTSTGIRRAWWETLPLNDAEPYADKAWTYHQTTVTVEESCEPSEMADRDDLDCEASSWWESIGGEGPKPYATAAWRYIGDSELIIELIAISITEMTAIDAGLVPDPAPRADYDAGTFNNPSDIYIDGVFYTSTGYAIEVERTFAEIKVYDSLASSPGPLPTISQPLGSLVTEPTGSGDTLLLDPSTLGDTGMGTDPYDVGIESDVPPFAESKILVQGGSIDGLEIEFDRLTTRQDDVPPGALLGQVNYEIFGQVVTVTSWEHYNWEDDTPIRKAIQAMLNGLPDGINEVRVLDEPTAFWQSLGFKRAYKGDPYIHYFLA